MRPAALILGAVLLAGCAVSPLPTGTPVPPEQTAGAGDGVPLTITADGSITCLIPHGCDAVLSLLPLPDGVTPPPGWFDQPRLWFQIAAAAAGPSWDVGSPIDPPSTIGPGRYLVIAAVRFISDVSSQAPNGSTVFATLGANTCERPLVVGEDADHVTVDVRFRDQVGCTVEVVVD